ncbi:MAG: DEAD/DEAH box helicase [Desulfobacter postgatei]|uniref:DEAD/DEAH box helicase n=1 Tax=Desulfobacter postgatei TaxID=2293 RepID=UPI0023F3B0FD|nr:DEAD/DEAH box helicase [Desulfobacter postgatei]MDD4274942.1 DEAD/DEAH box helicase [Desulfobacter postgatei]
MDFTLNSKAILTNFGAATRQAVEQYLTMPNPKFLDAVKQDRYTGGMDLELKFYEKDTERLICPRGCAGKLYRLCERLGESIQVVDNRRKLSPVDFTFAGELRPLQEQAVTDVLRRDSGLLEAGTGAGKTVMALYLIVQRKQPALIIVHTKELLTQWIDRIENFLGIPRADIGIIGGGKFSIGDRITVATVQSLYKRVDEVVPYVGHLVVDETHKAPARMFTEAVSAFDAKYRLGLTATPWRRDKLSKVIFWYVGDVTGRIAKDDLVQAGNLCRAEVQWVGTGFSPFADASEEYSKALSELTEDGTRNRLICKTVSENNGHGVSLILSDRKAHCVTLQNILSDVHGIQAEVLTGSTSPKERERIITALHDGGCRYLIATGQLIGEGFDLPGISTVFLTTPVKFSGRLIQYIGRALRPAPGKDKAMIFDFVDDHGVFEASARARAYTYQGQGIMTGEG